MGKQKVDILEGKLEVERIKKIIAKPMHPHATYVYWVLRK